VGSGALGAPLEWDTIPRLVRWAVERFPESEAVVDGDLRLTYAELGARVERAARGFVAAGVEPGDRVALWAPNGPAWVEAVLGLESVGAVLVPLSTRYKGAEAAYILGRSRTRVLVAAGQFLGVDFPALLAGHDLPDLEGRVVLGAAAPEGWQTWDALLAAGEDVPGPVVDERAAAVGPDDLCDLMFTSGTTGAPKGVMARHGTTLRVFREYRDIVGLRPGDRYLIVNPMSHSFGYKAGVLVALMSGVTMVPMAVFDVDAVFEAVATERISMLPGPPTLYQSLLNRPKRDATDLSSLRLAVTGAAVIPTELVRRMLDELGFESVITAYGLTEASGFVTSCRQGDDIDTIATTSGRAIPGVEVRIVDDDGKEAERGQPGEIVCRGYNVMSGYFEDPEATAEAIDADGWLHTGDVGTMDPGGNIRVTDRKKDMFIVGGFNAYPAEIENLLLRHPGVAQVAVVGVPDERMGEVGVAFVVPVHGATVAGEEIVDWAKGEMANYKVPRRVHVVDSLPVNAAGKVLKFELRRRG
jgi:HIP---CoA ligase